MQAYKREFIQFCLDHQILKFGEFTLKSGRLSPYFFNAGLFNTGFALATLGEFYAAAIQAADISYDMLFGPAYKGIPLVSATVIALAKLNIDKPFAFNRKEAKDHGEGGQLVGAPLQGKVLIIDDVITAGTAVRESFKIMVEAGAIPAGVVVALDRQERGQNTLSAIQEVRQQYRISVLGIIQLDDIIAYVAADPKTRPYLPKIEQYRQEYGTT